MTSKFTEDLVKTLETLGNLQDLHLEGNHLFDDVSKNSGFITVIGTLKKLRCFSLDTNLFCPDTVSDLTYSFRNLEHLNTLVFGKSGTLQPLFRQGQEIDPVQSMSIIRVLTDSHIYNNSSLIVRFLDFNTPLLYIQFQNLDPWINTLGNLGFNPGDPETEELRRKLTIYAAVALQLGLPALNSQLEEGLSDQERKKSTEITLTP